ncbi:MAG: alpha/beta hydrolase [Gammaproteobacteria bacterium]
MTDAPLRYEPETPEGVLILLHGLGATGADLFPLAEHLCGGRLRVVCPHAPTRAVAVNGGMRMPAWYDIAGANLEDRQDETGIQESTAATESLLAAEIARGFPSRRIFLGGFSQGAALSLHAGLRHENPLAGIVALSGYMLRGETLPRESSAANLRTSIFQAHGTFDPVVLPAWARQCRDILRNENRPLRYEEYPAAHAIPPQTVADLSEWMGKILAN